MELKTYLEIFARRKWIAIAAVLLGLLAAQLINLSMTPVYSANTTLRVAGASIGLMESSAYQYVDTLMNTYTMIAVSRPVLDEVQTTLFLSTLSGVEIDVQPVPDTELLIITVESKVPQEAEAVANTLAQILMDRSRQLYIGGSDTAQDILTQRLAQAEQDLREAQVEYEILLRGAAVADAELEAVRSRINFREQMYFALLEKYEEARLKDAVPAVEPAAEVPVGPSQGPNIGAPNTAQDILGQQLSQAEVALREAQVEYETLLGGSAIDEAELESIRGKVDFREQMYSALLERYEEVRLRETVRINAITVVEPADVPKVPSRPRPALYLALGAVLGGIGGFGSAMVAENLDSTIRSRSDVERVTGKPILAEIPDHRPRAFFPPRKASSDLQNSRRSDEAFRELRMRLMPATEGDPGSVIVITSAEAGEGKSTIVANLASSMARIGASVVIVDSDMRAAAQHQIWDLPNELGLTTVLTGQSTLEEALQTTAISELKVLTSGPTSSASADLLNSPEMVELVEHMRSRFNFAGVNVLTSGPSVPKSTDLLSSPVMVSLVDELAKRFRFVLIDSPCILPVADVSTLAQFADSVVLVVAHGRASIDAVSESLQRLEYANADLVGVVINRSKLGRNYDGFSGGRSPSMRMRARTRESEAKEVRLPASDGHYASTMGGMHDTKRVEGEQETDQIGHGEIKLQELQLSNRILIALAEAGIATIGHVREALIEGGDQALLAIKGIGPKGLHELKERLRALGVEIP